MKPYIAKVAYYLLPENDFYEVLDAINENTEENINVRELDNGDMYYEFEPKYLNTKELPVIGDVKKLNVDIIHVWLDN